MLKISSRNPVASLMFLMLSVYVVYSCSVLLGATRLASAYFAGATLGAVTGWLKWDAIRGLWTRRKDDTPEIDPLKSPWGNGTELFANEWVLELSVTVPPINFSSKSMVEFHRRVQMYCQIASAAVAFFPDGKYLIGRDGSMRKIVDDETLAFFCELPQVKAAIDFDDLPRFDTIEHRLKTSSPTSAMEKAQNCVLIDVHAHGTILGSDEVALSRMPRFATRDGMIIVESC